MMSWLRRGKGVRDLAVLGYHRVGCRTLATHDPHLFTVDAQQLESHIRHVKQHCRVVGLEEALEIGAGREKSKTLAVLFTFDDGYRDNFDTAFPILQAHSVPAVFFLVSSFAAGGMVPWWDRVAWLVKAARGAQIALGTEIFELGADRVAALPGVLDHYKTRRFHGSAADFVQAVEKACGVAVPTDAPEMFLSFAHARLMQAAGMTIGSHTHTHPILSRLDAPQQTCELSTSRRILETELGAPVHVLAYPGGGQDDFSADTQAIARDCGYRAAFSYYGGVNRAGSAEPFNIKRIPVYWGAQARDLLET